MKDQKNNLKLKYFMNYEDDDIEKFKNKYGSSHKLPTIQKLGKYK